MKLLTHLGRGLLPATAVLAVLAFATGAIAQVVNCGTPGEPGDPVTNCGGGATTGMDTAYVPVKVNVPAVVTAELLYCPDGQTGCYLDLYSMTMAEVTVAANTEDTLKIPLQKGTGVLFGAQRRAGAGVAVSNRGGRVTVSLPAQSYKNAEISLYSVNGKRVLRGNASAASASNSITRRNMAAGAYLLSVRGSDGAAVATRLTHRGGNMSVSVAFGNGSGVSTASRLAKRAEEGGDWELRVTPLQLFGLGDTSFKFSPTPGINPKQNIIVFGKLVDERDGKEYRTVRIDGHNWLAQNMNYETPVSNCQNCTVLIPAISACYNDSAENCAVYGRLYNRYAAEMACPNGWSLPNSREWDSLVETAGGPGKAGTMLRSKDSWLLGRDGEQVLGMGTDDFGFSALAGGYKPFLISFEGLMTVGGWWAPRDDDANLRHVRTVKYNLDEVMEREAHEYGELWSVRCVQITSCCQPPQ